MLAGIICADSIWIQFSFDTRATAEIFAIFALESSVSLESSKLLFHGLYHA